LFSQSNKYCNPWSEASLPQHGAGSLARRVAGTLLGCKPQNDFHFLQSLQVHRSELRQTDGHDFEKTQFHLVLKWHMPALTLGKCRHE
jgi:hypothetical protein